MRRRGGDLSSPFWSLSHKTQSSPMMKRVIWINWNTLINTVGHIYFSNLFNWSSDRERRDEVFWVLSFPPRGSKNDEVRLETNLENAWFRIALFI